MKKAVTLICLVAVFVVVSCASDTEPESNEMTLSERAGVYTANENKNILILRTDGTGTYVNGGKLAQLIIGSHDSADMSFKAVEDDDNNDFKAKIEFYADDLNKVTYGATPTTLIKLEF